MGRILYSLLEGAIHPQLFADEGLIYHIYWIDLKGRETEYHQCQTAIDSVQIEFG
jgi:hypothetical protein